MAAYYSRHLEITVGDTIHGDGNDNGGQCRLISDELLEAAVNATQPVVVRLAPRYFLGNFMHTCYIGALGFVIKLLFIWGSIFVCLYFRKH